jgi:glycosyltransferase involved in cell wall biosynthesis
MVYGVRDRKILLVSHWYAPALHPRAFRWSAIAAQWVLQGKRVDAVCSWVPGLAREEVADGVRIFRVGNGILGRLKNRLNRPPAFRAGSGVVDVEPRRGASVPSSLAAFLSDTVWKKIRWPDYACAWYFPAVREARSLAAGESYDAIVSVSDPFTGHLVGKRLKKEFPELTWLADVGDPFSFQDATPVNNVRLYDRRNVSAEREVFSGANAVVVTNPAAMDEYSARFPESAWKLRVIPPLLSLQPPPPDTAPLFPDDGRLRLVFVGTLYRDVRNPAFLLRLFERLLASPLSERLELHFFGDTNDCRDYFAALRADIAGKIRRHGMVDRGMVARAMGEAAALVHIGNSTRYQLPSKVVEYAAAGRPVINIVRVEGDSSVAFFEGHPAVRHVVEGEGMLESGPVSDLVRFIESAYTVPTDVLEDWISPFRVEAVSCAYARLLRGETGYRP